MIITIQNNVISSIDSTGILIGLSIRFNIAQPQSISGNSSIPLLKLYVKSNLDFNWNTWTNLPLITQDLVYNNGYFDLMRYLAVPSIDLSATQVGLSTVNVIMGIDSVIALVSIARGNSAIDLIPDDFLPY